MATARLPLVVILGATGAGKSKLAIEIAKMFRGEIISADSMQIYKGLDIITNKVSPEEQQECSHHLISYLEADHPHYNIVDFRDAALPIIDDLLSKRILPIVVGGTNYYIESILWNFLIDKMSFPHNARVVCECNDCGNSSNWRHSSSTNTKADTVLKATSPQINSYIRNKPQDSSRIPGTEVTTDHLHSGSDTSLVDWESVATAKEKLNAREISIAGFARDEDCSFHTPDLQQPSSSFQQTSLSSGQVLQSCSSHSQTLSNGSSEVLEYPTSTSPSQSPVQCLQPNVGIDNLLQRFCATNMGISAQFLQTSATNIGTDNSLQRFCAEKMGTSAQSLQASAANEGASNYVKLPCINEAFIEDPSVPRVGRSACDNTLFVDTTFVHSGDSPVATGDQVTEALHCGSGFSHGEFDLSCDVSSKSSGLSHKVSSDNLGLSHNLSPDIHGLLPDIHGLSCDVNGLSYDADRLSGDVCRLQSDDGGSSCEISDNSELSQLSQEDETNEPVQNPEDFRHDSTALLRCLNSMSPVDLFSHLQKIDPQTASRMHPNNRRKIVRAIQVYYQCDRTMSSLLSEQHGGQENVKSGPLRYSNPCILWVQCQQPDLNARLDGRVDEMMARGLLAELEQFHKEAARLELEKRNSSSMDTGYAYTHGILQMIGFKEFHDYLQLSPEDRATESGQKLLQQGVLDLKQATRRYARQQVRWITNRFCNRPGENVPHIYSVDATDLTQWSKTAEEAIEVVRAFIEGEVPTKTPEMIVLKVDTQFVRNVCDLCEGRIFVHLHEWTDHLKSKKHKFNVKMLARKRQQLTQLLSAREQQLKQMSLSTVGGPEASSQEDNLFLVSL